MGLQDFGNASLDCNHLPADPGQALMRAAKAKGNIQDFQVTFSDNSTATFQGFVLSNPLSGGTDAKVGGSFTVRVSGDVTFA